jgi:hemolysin D
MMRTLGVKIAAYWKSVRQRMEKPAADHHDFRPILAEIEERPVNPLGRIFLWTIVGFMALAVLGMCFLKIDMVVSARGKIIPAGDVKVLQPLETGVVVGIHVKEGDFVKAGSVLMEIDPSIDRADLEGKEKNLKFSRLAMERANAVLGGAGFNPPGKAYTPETLRTQKEQYLAQRAVHDSTLRGKEKEFQEVEKSLKSLKEEVSSIRDILAVIREDERRQKALVQIGALAENRYREKVRDRLNMERELEVKAGQVDQAAEKLGRIREEMEIFRSTFREKLLAELATNTQGKNTLEAEVSNLKFKQEKRFIVAPVNGYIHLLPVKTPGGVVTTAQTVVTLVPEGTPLVVKALVQNRDIGFVREGQECVVKVDTYDFQKYGTIAGTLATVSPFVLEEKEKEARAENESGFPVFVALLSEELKTKDGLTHRIRPGMSATAEVRVGERRVIEFFLFPVIKYLDEGLKVR